jgi:excisionase family DNA binding protein
MSGPNLPRGLSPNEVAKVLRVSADRVRAWITSGQLGAINTAGAACGGPRYVVLPHHLTAFERARAAGPAPKPGQRRKRTEMVDYYPD